MQFKRFYSEPSGDENIFWASMSDLLLGLLVVFIVLFSLAVTGLTKDKVEQESMRYKIADKLSQEFNKAGIPIQVEKASGNIKISELELFELNKWDISPKGKNYLNKVIPTYLNTLLGNPEISKNISQIIIEGHTDSQSFKNSRNQNENYIRNLDLSLKRAFSVTEYIINLDYPEKYQYKNKLINLLSTDGRSFSSPVRVMGKEDFMKSRRVELKFQLKDSSFMEILKKYKIKN